MKKTKEKYTKSQMRFVNKMAGIYAKEFIRNNGKLTRLIMAKAFCIVLKIKNARKAVLQSDISFNGRHFGHFKMVFERTKKPKHKKD